MQVLHGTLVFSASDLTAYLACAHLTVLERSRAADTLRAPDVDLAEAEVSRRRGLEHEATYLAELRATGANVVEIAVEFDEPLSGVIATREAMHSGADVVFQGAFLDGGWQGFADFLVRVDDESDLGPFSYEPVDTKLARSVKPYHVLQLCLYAEQVAGVQGRRPTRAHVKLGTGELVTLRLAEYEAYYRRLKARFLRAVSANGAAATYPWPVAHCGQCRWDERCTKQREADDHLTLVAWMRRDQAVKLEQGGIATLAQLAVADPMADVPAGMNRLTFATLRDQARLQHRQRTSGEPEFELLAHQPDRGLALLPQPDPADVFFDMEGDPYVEGGLEYLFGLVFERNGVWVFDARWAHDPSAERQAFEGVVDFLMERWRANPRMHVFHYAAYEETALKRLAQQYGTREEEVDDLLRAEVLVDLFRIVRQGLRISQPSYSIKALEIFYGRERTAAVKDAGGSIVEYERWLESGEDAVLEGIARYNEEDCRSTLGLRNWLIERRSELVGVVGEDILWRTVAVKAMSEAQQGSIAETAEVRARLLEGLPDDLETEDPGERARVLLADLLDYHRREGKPVWWRFFERLEMSEEQLLDDPECISRCRPEQPEPVRMEKQSAVYRLRFQPQEHRFRPGSEPVDPSTGDAAGEIVAIDREQGWLELKRGPRKHAGVPLPKALIPGNPYRTTAQRQALQRVARSVLAGDRRYAALDDILGGFTPPVAGVARGAPLQGPSVEVADAQAICRALDTSHLFVQGPPGSGKTYTGARMVLDLLRSGKRVGVAALSHKAIHKLLEEVEAAAERGERYRAFKRCSENGESEYRSKQDDGWVENSDDMADVLDPHTLLVAGTAWLFAREEMDATLDYLFIDEAGQISLADALAMGTSAHNLVLLGDPQQLPQVTQGTHPRGSGCSILEHLLGDAETIPPERGLFLERTYRMHPDVCDFISEVVYDGRLVSAPGCERQRVDSSGLSGTGLRTVLVDHKGNSQSSPEEAAAIAAEVNSLLDGGTWTDSKDTTHPLRAQDMMVVTPYNMQVATLMEALPPEVPVGTVDKFQGQEAPVVFFSMATSSGDELPHSLEFLFSRNRLNVALSRARCLSVLVASPRLLEVDCRTIEQMKLINALCRAVELAPST
ncbi:MAG: hypothetical protein V7607_5863 [Solirubrobacteraceae bacterium]